MATTEHQFTPSGRIKKPSLEFMVSWIAKAWNEIEKDIIIHAFKKCCISNALDGSEDDYLFQLLPEYNNEDSSSEESDDSDIEG